MVNGTEYMSREFEGRLDQHHHEECHIKNMNCSVIVGVGGSTLIIFCSCGAGYVLKTEVICVAPGLSVLKLFLMPTAIKKTFQKLKAHLGFSKSST